VAHGTRGIIASPIPEGKGHPTVPRCWRQRGTHAEKTLFEEQFDEAHCLKAVAHDGGPHLRVLRAWGAVEFEHFGELLLE
jgi:hypothetical protein